MYKKILSVVFLMSIVSINNFGVDAQELRKQLTVQYGVINQDESVTPVALHELELNTCDVEKIVRIAFNHLLSSMLEAMRESNVIWQNVDGNTIVLSPHDTAYGTTVTWVLQARRDNASMKIRKEFFISHQLLE